MITEAATEHFALHFHSTQRNWYFTIVSAGSFPWLSSPSPHPCAKLCRNSISISHFGPPPPASCHMGCRYVDTDADEDADTDTDTDAHGSRGCAAPFVAVDVPLPAEWNYSTSSSCKWIYQTRSSDNITSDIHIQECSRNLFQPNSTRKSCHFSNLANP